MTSTTTTAPTTGDKLIDLEGARQLLAEVGVTLNPRQMRRITEPDATGQRKLPFFPCPLTGKLRCWESELKKVIQTWH